MWKIIYLPEAEEDLKRLDGSQRILTLKAIKATPHKLQSFRLAEVYQHILWITSAVLPAKAH